MLKLEIGKFKGISPDSALGNSKDETKIETDNKKNMTNKTKETCSQIIYQSKLR